MKIRGSESLPEVRDAGPVAVRRDPNDPGASAMTAAAGMSARAGEYIARGIHDLAAGIDKMARDRTEAGALAAYNDYVSRSSKLLYDADTGLMHAKGAGAEGLADRAYKAHKTLKDEIMHKLPAGQRKLFADRTASYDRSVGVSCMKHEGEQMSIYRQEEADRTLSTICTAAALDPDSFSMEAQEDAFREITIAKFGDQGAEANLKNSGLVRSAFFMGMIQQVAQSDPMRAEALVAEYGRYMEPADAQKLKISVEKAALPAKAQAEAQRLHDKYGVDGIAQALDEIRETHEGKEEDVYISYVNSLFSDKKQERDAAREKICEAADDLINKGAGYSRVSAFLSQNEAVLGPRLYRRLKEDAEREYKVGRYAPKMSGGGSGRSKIPPALKLKLFYQAKKDLADGKFSSVQEFMEAYADAGFSYSDLKALTYPVFGKSAKGGKDEYNRFNALSTVTKMTRDFGLDEDPEEEMAFWRAYSATCHEKEREKKSPLTNEEKVDIARDMFSKQVINREYNGLENFVRKTFGVDWFSPDKETTAYTYQIEAGRQGGYVSVGDSTGVPYTVDDEGNIRGWQPDATPELKKPDKRKIKGEGFYPEEPADKADEHKNMFPYADIKTEKPSGKKEENKKNSGVRFSPRQ